jgi:hypothetical protein
MCESLTTQVRSIGSVTTAVAKGDLSKMIEIEAEGEMAVLKNVRDSQNPALTTDRQFHGAAAHRVRQRGHPSGARGRDAGYPRRPGPCRRRRRGLGGSHDKRQQDGTQPDRPSARNRRGHQIRRSRRPHQDGQRRRPRRDPRPQDHRQRHGGAAHRVRRGGDPCVARGRHRGTTGRPGAGAQCRRDVEGADGQRQPDGEFPTSIRADVRRSTSPRKCGVSPR